MTEAGRARPLFAFLDEAALAVLFAIGVWAPWTRAATLTWLRLPGVLTGSAGFPFAYATVAVTIGALVLVAGGALLRLWSTMRSAGSASTALSYLAWLRMRLAGAWVFAAGISILLPVSSAVGFLLLLLLVYLLLAMRAARSRAEAAQTADTGPRPWAALLAHDSLYVGFAVCMGVLAWRYNPTLLLRALVICLGGSLVLRALFPLPLRG